MRSNVKFPLTGIVTSAAVCFAFGVLLGYLVIGWPRTSSTVRTMEGH